MDKKSGGTVRRITKGGDKTLKREVTPEEVAKSQ